MDAFFVFRIGRKRWYVLPVRAIKCAVIALVIVLATLFFLDRIVLPGLERQGLTAGDDWSRHNAIVLREHQLSDRTVGFPETSPPLVPAGIRTWVGNPVNVEKDPGKKRILVMGDSFVWGSAYLSLNHMWWRQLGQILERDSVEVIALGRPGASTRDQLKWAKYFVPQYKPDLIIWGYVTNDADEGLVRQIGMSQDSIPRLDRIRKLARSIWPRLMAKFDSLRSKKLAAMYTGPKYGYEYSEWELMLVAPENLAAYAETVRDVKSFIDATGVPSFMMTLPNFPSTARFNPRHEPVLRVWRDAGIAAYDATPEFVRRYGETPLSGSETIKWGINPADGHPGPRSCRFLAEMAADIIRSNFQKVLGPPSQFSQQPAINDWLPSFEPESISVLSDPQHPGLEMIYPHDETRFPTMPLGIPTPVLAMKTPVPLRSIDLKGPSLKSARLWVTFLDPAEQYDDGIVHDLGELHGDKLSWQLPLELASRPISVIRYQATFSPANRKLIWLFQPKSPEGQ